ncbi:MAG: DUF1902 domain-containing protein [Gammaproteobacteria bacterium]|nr:DUF1902 domain-containing protein [Gammaproteobacteria bacterium]
MTNKRYQISVTTCAESGVLVGTSSDIPGLTLEANSHEQLLAAVSDVVPQLLTHNLKLPENQLAECVVEVIFTHPSAKPMPDSAIAPSCPRILVEHVDAAVAHRRPPHAIEPRRGLFGS